MDNSWLVLFWSSSVIQLIGLSGSIWQIFKSYTIAWRLFWIAFAIDWVFALTHQVLVSFLTPEPLSFPVGLMKLGAMVTQLFVMFLALKLNGGKE